MLRLTLMITAVYFSQGAFATQLPDELAQEATGDEPEKIIARESLATHLGLGPQDVVFASPRNFRSEQMNQVSLEPLDAAEAEDLEAN